MEGWPKIFALGFCLAFFSCTTPQTHSPEQAPEYVTIRDYTPFYRVGPMQPRPDASLPANTRFKLLRQEMGYSFVQLEDSRTGYVANENMALAPPRPKVENEYAATADGASPGRRKRGNTSAVYRGEQLNDIPLPAPNTPPPDLNIAPEEVPAPTPTPTPPLEKPKFRF